MDNKFFNEINCPVCNESRFKKYIEVEYSQLKQKENLDYSCIGIDGSSILTTVKCSNCAFVFTNPRPSKDAEEMVYNEAKKIIKPSLTIKRRSNYMKTLFCALSEFKPDEKVTIFDFGSGFGHSLIMAEAMGHNGYGIEIDKKRLEYCKNKNLKVSTPKEFFDEFGQIKADIILMQSVIEHVVDLNETLNFINKISNNGTVLLLNGIHPRLIDIEKKKGLFVKAHFIEHINYFYIKTLDNYLSSYGFKPIKNRTYNKNVNSLFQIVKLLLQILLPIGLIAHFTGYFDRIYKKIN